LYLLFIHDIHSQSRQFFTEWILRNGSFEFSAAARGWQGIQAERVLKIDLQLFLKRLQFPRLLDNLSFRGMENLQVNVVQ